KVTITSDSSPKSKTIQHPLDWQTSVTFPIILEVTVSPACNTSYCRMVSIGSKIPSVVMLLPIDVKPTLSVFLSVLSTFCLHDTNPKTQTHSKDAILNLIKFGF